MSSYYIPNNIIQHNTGKIKKKSPFFQKKRGKQHSRLFSSKWALYLTLHACYAILLCRFSDGCCHRLCHSTVKGGYDNIIIP